MLIGRLLVEERHDEAEKLARSVRRHRSEARTSESHKRTRERRDDDRKTRRGARERSDDNHDERRGTRREKGTTHFDVLDELFSDEVKTEILKVVREVEKEVRKGIHEAREEIEDALAEAPPEVRQMLRKLNIEQVLEEGLRRAPHFIMEVLRELDFEETAREPLRKIEPYHFEDLESRPENPIESRHSDDQRKDTRKLQRRVEELEGAIGTLLREIKSLRREIESQR